MKIEVMIYIYGAVCVSMIVFNIVYSFFMKAREPWMEKRCKKMKRELEGQLSRLRQGEAVENSHQEYLLRNLRKVNDLIAFHQVIQECIAEDPESCREYLRQNRSVAVYLARVYLKKEDMQAAYFTYFLSCCTADKELAADTLQDVLLDYVRKKNLYCRFNALKALYHFADPEHIAEAVEIQDDGIVFFHGKLLTEGLLSYTGDHGMLISRLWERFESYSSHTQLAILNYIRFQSGEYKEKMYDIMVKETADKELRLAAIRYFGKYYYEPARKQLLAFVGDKDPGKWEYTTVAASSLSLYPDEKVIFTLKEALRSSNWHSRYSAAQSLERLCVDYSDVIDIAYGSDRYAREMMMYRLESRRLQSLGEL